MSKSRNQVFLEGPPPEDKPWLHLRLSDTDRLEAFSDGVLAITVTLLVAEIVRPDPTHGQLLERLAVQWTSYIAFLASFSYASVIWLNHRAVFSRVRYCDRSVHLTNLLILLTTALIPFPTAVLSTAIQSGDEFDSRIAVTLYAAIAGAMCLSWLVLFHVLSIRPYLVERHIDPTFFPKERLRALLGMVLYVVAGIVSWVFTSKLALLIFLALPIFYGITSEGLTETRFRLQFGRVRHERSDSTDRNELHPLH